VVVEEENRAWVDKELRALVKGWRISSNIKPGESDPVTCESADKGLESTLSTPKTIKTATLALRCSRRDGLEPSGAPRGLLGSPTSREIFSTAAEEEEEEIEETTSTRLPFSPTSTESSEGTTFSFASSSKGATIEAATRAGRRGKEEEEDDDDEEEVEGVEEGPSLPSPPPPPPPPPPVGAAAAPASHASARTAAAQRSNIAEAGRSALPATLWSRSHDDRRGEEELLRATPNSTREEEEGPDGSLVPPLLLGSRSSGCCLGHGHALARLQGIKGAKKEAAAAEEEWEPELLSSTACALTPDIPNDDADASGTTTMEEVEVLLFSLPSLLPLPPPVIIVMSPLAGPAPRGITQGEGEAKAAAGAREREFLPPLPPLLSSASLQSSAAEAT